MKQSKTLGTESIGKLLIQQSVPSAIGILVMSVYMIADTIFVGQWVGILAIAAITVVLPITFLIAAIGMGIGVGGASIISRALGAGRDERAMKVFGNQISMIFLVLIVTIIPGIFFQETLLTFFGAKGEVFPQAQTYFRILLPGVPFLAYAMMSNHVIRAIGHPKVSMNIMLIPAIANLILDPIFIYWMDWGLAGAALATTISYVASASYSLWFFVFGKKSELRIRWKDMKLEKEIVGEITSLGIITISRQGTVSILAIILNNSLFAYGGEIYIAVYGIINRIMMFALFPVLGITQGMVPIAGYNYGAQAWSRVKEVIKKSILYGTFIAIGIFILLLSFRKALVSIFSEDPNLLELTAPAIIIVFAATPIITVQLIGAAYFQAIGKAIPALVLTLLRQGIFLIPLILLLPLVLGVDGLWYAFPIADVSSAVITFLFLRKNLKKLGTV